ncbi:helix-turn-helix domain-containing protein [Sulfitobacter sp. 1A13421]
MKDHLHQVSSQERLGACIRSRRIELGLDQNSLAEVAGITQANLSRLERGKLDGRLSTYMQLTEALGIDLFIMGR